MPQKFLSFQYQGDSRNNFTAYAGLPLFLEMSKLCGLTDAIKQCLSLKKQGWLDVQTIQSLILLNLAGGDCVEDIDKLELDQGLRKLLLAQECKGMGSKERRTYLKRFRKPQTRSFPSASAILRYLSKFHHAKEESQRREGTAFIPQANNSLKSLLQINKTMLNYIQHHCPCEIGS